MGWNPRDLLGEAIYVCVHTHTLSLINAHRLNTDFTCAQSHLSESQEPAVWPEKGACSPGMNPHIGNVQSWVTENDSDGHGEFTLCHPSVTGQKTTLTCNGAAYSPAPSPDAGAVPDHGVLRALVSVAHPVSVPRVLVKARLFSCRKNESPCEPYTGKNFSIPLLSSKRKPPF